MKEGQDITALIHKYLTGQVTQEENRRLEQWLQESEANRQTFEEIRLIWEASEEERVEVSETEMEEGLQRLEAALGGREKKRKRPVFRTLYRKAAVIGLLALSAASAIAFYAQYDLARDKVAISGKGNLLLPDSVEVFTNKETTVSFRQNLWKRIAHLDGEAFFDVRRYEGRPFYVHAGETAIQALGGAFLASAYPGEPVTISVVSGRVAVFQRDRRVEIGAGERLEISGQGQISKSATHDPNLLGWKTGNLVFQNSPLKLVLKELEKLYEVEFAVEDRRILDCRFTGKFEKLSLGQTMEILAFSLRLSVDYIDNRLIQLSGAGGCP